MVDCCGNLADTRDFRPGCRLRCELDLDALDIDVLRILQIECPGQAEAAKNLSQVRLVQFRVGRAFGIARPHNFAQGCGCAGPRCLRE